MNYMPHCEIVITSSTNQRTLIDNLYEHFSLKIIQTDSPHTYAWAEPMPNHRLLLVDYALHESSENKPQIYGKLTATSQVALFNAKPHASLFQDCLCLGLNGIIFDRDSIQTIVKGITAMLAGELWYQRRAMTWALKNLTQSTNAALPMASANGQEQSLTTRERDILNYLGKGSTNQQIAEKLHISVHTVRTHIYRIYKKLDVNNRVEALNRFGTISH